MLTDNAQGATGIEPFSVPERDISSFTECSLKLALAVIDDESEHQTNEQLRSLAIRWAHLGWPIEVLHHAIGAGFVLGLDRIVSDAPGAGMDRTHAVARVIDLLGAVSSSVAVAYLGAQANSRERSAVKRRVAAALLDAQCTSSLTRQYGVKIAESYCLVVLAFPARPTIREAASDLPYGPRQMEVALDVCCGDDAVALFGAEGGVLLVSDDHVPDTDLAELVRRLSSATRLPITAVVGCVPAREIPSAAEYFDGLLGTVLRMGNGPGVYRPPDFALEHQLTRPGPSREFLRAVLDPLDEHPILLRTLDSYVRNNFNRQRTARDLNIHANTVTYRLKRVGVLTGCNPTESDGIWRLRSALIARH